jgi:carboxylate-amine ligase
VLAENRFLAARDGMRAQIIDAHTVRKRSIRGALTELLGHCESIASSLGCAEELAAASALAADPGAARQRRLAERDGVTALPEWLGEEFTAVDIAAAAV